jgi:hypothetical protein
MIMIVYTGDKVISEEGKHHVDTTAALVHADTHTLYQGALDSLTANESLDLHRLIIRVHSKLILRTRNTIGTDKPECGPRATAQGMDY